MMIVMMPDGDGSLLFWQMKSFVFVLLIVVAVWHMLASRPLLRMVVMMVMLTLWISFIRRSRHTSIGAHFDRVVLVGL